MPVETPFENLFENDYNNALSKRGSYLGIYAANIPIGSSTGAYRATGYFAHLKNCGEQVISQYKRTVELAENEGIPNPKEQVLHNLRILLDKLDPEIRNSVLFKDGLTEILRELGDGLIQKTR